MATVDTAISTAAGADFTVIQVWDVLGPHKVLVHQVRKRLDGTKLVPNIAEVFKTYQPQFVSVEAEFVGRMVLDQLQALNIPVKAFLAKKYGDKEQRAVGAEIAMEAGFVWFPAGKDWVADLEKELLSFPNGAHDDQVDCISQLVAIAQKYQGQAEEPVSPEEQQAREKAAAEERFKSLLWQGAPW